MSRARGHLHLAAFVLAIGLPFQPTLAHALEAAKSTERELKVQALQLTKGLHDETKLYSGQGFSNMFDEAGFSAAIHDDIAVVGAPRSSDDGHLENGEVYVFQFHTGAWHFSQRLGLPGNPSGARAGHAIATDGLHIAVGVPDYDGGRVILFELDSGTSQWQHVQTLEAPSPHLGAGYGATVSIENGRLLIGEPWRDHGYAHFYERDPGTGLWEAATVINPPTFNLSGFGAAVDLDGERALIGAPLGGSVSGTGTDDMGAAYLYVRGVANSQPLWEPVEEFLPGDFIADGRFGFSVALSSNLALVGAYSYITGDPGSVYPFTQVGNSWSALDKLQAPNASAGDRFGAAIDIDGERALIGASSADGSVADSGAAYVFNYDSANSIWTISSQLLDVDAAIGDSFGHAVALDGDRALVGAPGYSLHGWNSGISRLFERNPAGGAWSFSESLVAERGGAFDQFGTAVAIDGNVAIVGAPQQDLDNGREGSGIAFAYSRDPLTLSWTQVAAVKDPLGVTNDRFGHSVDIDGDFAFVGAPMADGAMPNSGAVLVYQRDLASSHWSPSATLHASDGEQGDSFGYSVKAVGTKLLVGATTHGPDGGGAVYVFEFDSASSTWLEQQKLVPSSVTNSAGFGSSIDLAADLAVIGAPDQMVEGTETGAVFLYDLDTITHLWSEVGILAPENGTNFSRFGFSVSLNQDRLLIGAPHDEEFGASAGAAYLFEFDAHTADWLQERKFGQLFAGPGDHFGNAVALRGSRALISYTQELSEAGLGRAVLLTYDADAAQWQFSTFFEATIPNAHDRMGASVAMSDTEILIGAPGVDDRGTNSGAVYVFPQVNSAPLAQPDHYTVFEDFSISASDATGQTTSDPADDGLLANDRDGDADALHVVDPETILPSGLGGSLAVQADGTFQYSPPEDQSGVVIFDYRASDGLASSMSSVFIEVLPVNDPPTFVAGPDIVVNEDSGYQQINWASNISPGPPDESGQAVVFDVQLTDSTANLTFSMPPSINALGHLTFMPAPDSHGSASVEAIAMDDGGGANSSAAAPFTITVSPVNDPPGFDDAGPVEIFEDAGSVNVSWASNLSPGATNEAGQSLSFNITDNSNPGLFVSGPVIDNHGNLSFEPFANTTGFADLDVVLMDDGGVGNGGSDTSVAHPLRIDIRAAADLAIEKTSGSHWTPTGGTITYVLEINNAGPSDALNARVEDELPSRLGNIQWECMASAGASCQATGSGDIDTQISVPEGEGVWFMVMAELLDMDEVPITNTASITPANDLLEISYANNTDSDTDRVALFADSVESIEPD